MLFELLLATYSVNEGFHAFLFRTLLRLGIRLYFAS
jgi:hypothetical protein